jgi:hypothetical protein
MWIDSNLLHQGIKWKYGKNIYDRLMEKGFIERKCIKPGHPKECFKEV